MHTWYTIKALAADSAEISIFDEIGYWGVTAKDFIADLKKLGNVKNISLSINSPGGSVFDGFAIFNALKASGADITVKVMGIAASMASVIAMAGKKIEMPSNSMMMVHNAISGVYGDAENLREVADVLDKIDNSIVATYVARTGKSEQEVRDLMASDTFMSAAQAMELGFADVVTSEVKAVASFEIDRLPENVRNMFKASAAMPETKPGNTEPSDPPAAFAEQVSALADAAGMPEFAAHWALGYSDIKAVETAIGAAREVKALCALAKRDDDAAGFIKAATPVADVRTKLCEALAKQDEATHTSTTPKNPNPSKSNAQPAAVKTGDIWNARRKTINKE